MGFMQTMLERRFFKKGRKILKENATMLCNIDLHLSAMLATGDFDRKAVDGEYIRMFLDEYENFHVGVRVLAIKAKKIFSSKDLKATNPEVDQALTLALSLIRFAQKDIGEFTEMASGDKFVEKDHKKRYKELMTALEYTHDKFIELMEENEKIAGDNEEALNIVIRSRTEIDHHYSAVIDSLNTPGRDRYSTQSLCMLYDTIMGIKRVNKLLMESDEITEILVTVSDAIPEL